jgi:hypothetical protein
MKLAIPHWTLTANSAQRAILLATSHQMNPGGAKPLLFGYVRIGKINGRILLANSREVTPPWVVGPHNERCVFWPEADRQARQRAAPH